MATIWKRKDRDCWAVDYRDATGKRIRLKVSTRQDAEILLAEKIKEMKEAHPTALSLQDMTLKEYAERWSERVKGEIEEKTWRSYKQNLDGMWCQPSAISKCAKSPCPMSLVS